MKKPLTQKEVKRYKEAIKKALELHQKLMEKQRFVLEMTNKFGRNRIFDVALADTEIWELIEQYEDNINDLI
ncbi:hypothetical protein CAPN002_23480 [Capnocytophaga stomatis]|uniref:hypothetical protein n=1 Tax=Capnocytophaga stomatis TaxID=1848904 RepID=UPI0019529720|nr:hypothetical protein [Capnocytophaga stomatis]GIJ95130.1 hypothetical protein CAPN002_23480 [Capnocytophaga stomatis]